MGKVLLVPPMAGRVRWVALLVMVVRARMAWPVALAVLVGRARSVDPVDPASVAGKVFPGRRGLVVRSFPVGGGRPVGLGAVSGPEGRTRLEWAGCPAGPVGLGR
ncbi:hypothetical protein GCM10009735_18900 [Actinomadura chokoriensis]